jgi:hypothetical protein
MIVRTLADRIQLIRQPDHAHLAREVMERAPALAEHPRRESILLATGEHDASWDEPDAAPSVDAASGTVVDFMRAPLAVRQGVWPRTVARLHADPWAGALVAQHALVAYDRFRGTPEWSAFFGELEALRDQRIATCGRTLATLAEDYPYVRLGDLVSLAFCTGAREPSRYAGWTVTAEDGRVVVEPDPFGGVEVPLAVEARELAPSRFASDGELHEALRGARRVTLRGVAVGPR